MTQIHISLAAEKIGEIGIVPITNSILTTWIVMLFLVLFAIFVNLNFSLVPNRVQSIAEILIGGLYDLFHSIVGDKIKIYFPLVGTLFIYIVFMNWAGLLPGIGSIGLKQLIHGEEEFLPLFRSGSADLNTTLGLALVSMASIQFFGIKSLGVGYFSKFFNFKSPIMFYVGILELISEFSKIISFAFRLFGNVFAGEVLLTVIAFLMPLIAPLPFLGLELFVGFIQALVFSMLTGVFLATATAKEH
jgi:F-type H+-transporting ATPase subunit a